MFILIIIQILLLTKQRTFNPFLLSDILITIVLIYVSLVQDLIDVVMGVPVCVCVCGYSESDDICDVPLRKVTCVIETL